MKTLSRKQRRKSENELIVSCDGIFQMEQYETKKTFKKIFLYNIKEFEKKIISYGAYKDFEQ